MNPSSALAEVLLDELIRGGVRELVLAPGSRSAPLAYAALAAERAGRVRLHVRVDERSAGFLALGLALGSARPVPVVTTSGTAVANLHPAVLEAHHSGVPLIVLSADRPHELRGTGANQTTTQPGIFGDAVRLLIDLPAPERRAGQVAWWRATVGRVLAAAQGRGAGPGPVHLNVCLRDPLAPDVTPPAQAGGVSPDQAWPEPLEGRPDGEPWVRTGAGAVRGAATAPPAGGPTAPPAGGPSASLAGGSTAPLAGGSTAPLAGGPTAPLAGGRTLVVIGAAPAEVVTRAVVWARAHGWPVVAEPLGEHRRGEVVPHGPLLLTCQPWLDAHAPDRVVVVGRPTLTRSVASLLRRPGMRVELVTDAPAWADPSGLAAVVHPVSVLDASTSPSSGDIPDTPLTLDAAVDPAPSEGAPAGAWAAAWATAGERIAAAVRAAPPRWGSGPALAREIGSALPDGASLYLGSSTAVRDADLMLRAERDPSRPLLVRASRGLAGIDGCVSTAVGLALADHPCAAGAPAVSDAPPAPGTLAVSDAPPAPGTLAVTDDPSGAGVRAGSSGPDVAAERRSHYAWLGDLTLLHDANGLSIGPLEPRPDLTVIVGNDGGGGIFTTLEHGDPSRAQSFERIFATPTGTDFAALARAHGARHVRAATPEQFRAALAAPPEGITVVEVPIERGSHRAEHARLRSLAAEAVAVTGG